MKEYYLKQFADGDKTAIERGLNDIRQSVAAAMNGYHLSDAALVLAALRVLVSCFEAASFMDDEKRAIADMIVDNSVSIRLATDAEKETT